MAAFVITFIGDCSCSHYVAGNGYGNCKKSFRKGGPICYVNEPSTCMDLEVSSRYGNRRYSWEACERGFLTGQTKAKLESRNGMKYEYIFIPNVLEPIIFLKTMVFLAC